MTASLFVVGLATLLFASPAAQALPMRTTRSERFPRPQEDPVRPGPEAPGAPKKQRIFGIGVGFERSGTLAGVALSIVLPDSPAARAGLLPGCIISEINGELIGGRVGEDCARLIRDGTSKVRIKYLDPAMKEKVITLEKEWIVVPE